MLSVVIRGVPTNTPNDELKAELIAEDHVIKKCIRIITKIGTPRYMVRILTTDQLTIDNFLRNGAFIYKRIYHVEWFQITSTNATQM